MDPQVKLLMERYGLSQRTAEAYVKLHLQPDSGAGAAQPLDGRALAAYQQSELPKPRVDVQAQYAPMPPVQVFAERAPTGPVALTIPIGRGRSMTVGQRERFGPPAEAANTTADRELKRMSNLQLMAEGFGGGPKKLDMSEAEVETLPSLEMSEAEVKTLKRKKGRH